MKGNVMTFSLAALVLTVMSAPCNAASGSMQPMPKKPVPQHERKHPEKHRKIIGNGAEKGILPGAGRLSETADNQVIYRNYAVNGAGIFSFRSVS